MSEPKYITQLKSEFSTLSLMVTDRFARIETTLGVLPKIEEHLGDINDSIGDNKQDIALVKQSQEECPAKAAFKANPSEKTPDSAWGTATFVIKKFGVVGAFIVIVILQLLIMCKQQGVF